MRHGPHTRPCRIQGPSLLRLRGRAGACPATCIQHRVKRPAQGLAGLMHPGLPHAPRPAQPCRHGPALLSHRSRASHSLGITRAREHGMALLASAGSLCIDGGCSGMAWQVADSSGFRPQSHLCYGSGQPAHARLRGAGVAALPCRSGRRTVATPHRCLRCCRMPRWQPRWPASPAEPSHLPAMPASAVLEAALLCLWARGMDAERLNACMCGFDPMSSLLGREIARDRARSREMHVPVHCKTSCVMYSTQVSY